MKLLYITNGICGAGGLERVLSIKASMLAENFDYEVHLISLNEPINKPPFFNFSPKIFRHNIKITGKNIAYVNQYTKGIIQKIQQIKPDVILVCDDGLKAFFLPKILGKKTPIIYERHVSKLIEISENRNLLKKIQVKIKFALMNFLAQDFSKFIVLTEGNKKEWNLTNLEVIPNPLPTFSNKISPLQNKKVIAVGKQGYQKSYDRLLQIWAQIDKKFSDWELHIYGKKNANLNLENLAEQLQIQHSVHFHDPEKKIEDKYAESSIFVLSSRYEGFGMVIIEAMNFGIPCISFDCNYGPSDIITHNKDGFLIENGNIIDFAKKIEILMENETLRKNFGNTAKQNVQKYQSEHIVKLWDKLFKNLKTNK